jgi:hypothetical protein
LLDGADAIGTEVAKSEPNPEWMSPEFAEGGYLVDFDRRHIIVYSWDLEFIARLSEQLRSVWPDWDVGAVPLYTRMAVIGEKRIPCCAVRRSTALHVFQDLARRSSPYQGRASRRLRRARSPSR